MSELDANALSRVYHALNDTPFDWRPDLFAADYRQTGTIQGDGWVNWAGVILTGWVPSRDS